MSELAFDAVTVRFGPARRAFTAVDAVSLTVPAGRVTGLVGESGSGKSTLAAAAVGLVQPASGRVLLDGRDVTADHGRRARFRRRIQLVSQDPYSSLDPRLPVGSSIAEAMGATGARHSRKARRLRVRELPRTLSGGQRQRVALARALAADPSVVIADEITSSLDVSVQGTVLNLVRELQRDLGLTVLFISHDFAVVRYVSDDIAVMRHGSLVESGPADRVLEQPEHGYTRDLLSAVPRLGEPLDLTVR